MRRRSKVYYWICTWPTYLGGLLIAPLDLLLCSAGRIGAIDSVQIAYLDRHGGSPEGEKVLKLVKASLALIRDTDPRRWRRVCKEIAWVCLMPSIDSGSYSRVSRICSLDVSLIVREELPPAEAIELIACIVVHEATHGLLCSRGLVQTKRFHRRVEELCCREMDRFSARAGLPHRDWVTAASPSPEPLSSRLSRTLKKVREK